MKTSIRLVVGVVLGGATVFTVFGGSAKWNVDANGNWSVADNWTAGGPPNGVDEVAALTNNISARRQITVDQDVTIGTLLFGDPVSSYTAYRLLSSGGSVITMDVSSGSALIGKYYPSGMAGNVVNDTNVVQIFLRDDLIVSNASGGHLVLASNIFGAGYNLRVDGPGITNAGRVIFQSSNSFASVTIGRASFIASNAFAAGEATVTVLPGGTFYAGVSGITNPLIIAGHGFDQGIVGTIGSNGAIRLAHGVTLSSPITLAGDARLAAYQGSGTVAGVISGPYNVFVGFTGHPTAGTNTGANRLTFAADNTYEGWTYIEPHAQLRLGNNSAAGWVGAGPITNLGTLTFHRSDAVLITNWIAGDGRIQHLGSGSLTITQELVEAKWFLMGGTGPVVAGSDGALGVGTVEFNNAAAILRSADATDRVFTNGLVLSTGFIADGPGAITFLGDVDNGAASKTIIVSNSLLHFAGSLTNVGTMLKRGPGELWLGGTVAASSFTNFEGVVRLGPGGAFTNEAVAITLHADTVLDVSAATNAFVLGPLTILRGRGAIAGDVGSSGQVIPGLSAGTLTFSNNAAFSDATFPFELRTATTVGGGINDLIDVRGNLTLTGVSTVQVAAAGGALGSTYTLFTYGGTLSGGAVNLFAVADPTLRPGYVFGLDDTTPGAILLHKVADASATLTWAASTNVWDLMGAQSWSGAEVFYTGDRVQFTDAGADSNVVTLAGDLLPGEVLVASASNYVFIGSGRIRGDGMLIKEGPGILVLGNTNTYNGGTVVREGILQLSNSMAIPNNSIVVVTNTGAFDFNGVAPGTGRTNTFIIAGDGGDGLGAIRDSAGFYNIMANSGIYSVRLVGDATIGTAGRFDIGLGNAPGSVLDGGGFALTKIGTGTNSIRVETITNLPNLYINAGWVRYEGYSRMSEETAKSTNTVAAGAVLDVHGLLHLNMPVVLNGGMIRNNNSQQTWWGPWWVNADSAVATAQGNITNYGPIVATTAWLMKTNDNQLVVAGTNTVNGNLSVAQGLLVFLNDQVGGSGTVRVDRISGTTRVELKNTITVDRPLVIEASDPTAGNGTLQATVAGTTGTWSGPIVINQNSLAGGHVSSLSGAVLRLTGPITSSVPFNMRTGTVVLESDQSAYDRIRIGQGNLRLGGHHAIPTNATADIGYAGGVTATIWMDGYDQMLIAIYRNPSGAGATVANERVTSSTLTLAPPAGTNNVWAGVIRGNINLVKVGDGTTVLSGVNTFTGTTTVLEGLLLISNTLALAGSTVIPAGGAATIGFTDVTSVALGGLAGTGSIGTATTGGSPIDLLVGSNNQNTAFSGVIEGAGRVIKVGTGVLTLSGANTFSGGMFVRNGILMADFGQGIPAGQPLILTGGTWGASGTLAATLGNGAGEVYLAPAAAGGFSAVGGDLTVVLTGDGSTSLVWGTSGGFMSTGLILNAVSADGLLTLGNEIDLNAPTGTRAITVQGTNVARIHGAITGSGVLMKDGTGTLVLPVANTHTQTWVAGGILRLEHALALGPTTAVLRTTGGVLDLNGLDVSVRAPFGSGGAISNSAVGAATLRILSEGTDMGATRLRGDLNLWVVRGDTANMWTVLKGDNDYTGWTLVDGGRGAVTLSAQHSNALGDTATGTLVTPGGRLELRIGVSNRYVYAGEPLVFAGGGEWVAHDDAAALGRRYVWTGPVTLSNGTITVTAGSNALLLVTSPISGAGGISKGGLARGMLALAADCTFTGGVLNSAGMFAIGYGGTAGSVPGKVTNNASLMIYRSDSVGLSTVIGDGVVRGTGHLVVLTPEGLTVGSDHLITLNGNLSVGATNHLDQTERLGRLFIEDGAQIRVGGLYLGEANSITGRVVQTGGSVVVTNQLRVGHWPNNLSEYLLGGGTVELINTGTGDPYTSTAAEKNGVVYIGVDGTGLLRQTGGVLRAWAMVFDNRGETAGDDTYILEGGTLRIGGGGLSRGTNASYKVQWGGGTVQATASWPMWLPIDIELTGVNGDTVLDTQGFTVPLHGVLSGAGGLTKTGDGQLALSTNNTFVGTTRVQAGTLRLVGDGALASSTIQVDAGATLSAVERDDGTLTLGAGQTLKGGGQIMGGLIVGGGATLSPGLSPGVLTVTGDVSLESGSTFEVELLGTLAGEYDQLQLSGGTTFTAGGATLSVTAPNLLTLGFVFPIVSGWSLIDSTTFAGLPDAATFTAGVNQFQINYGTLPGYENDVTLTVIPEPTTLGLVVMIAVTALLRRRLC